nr:hypothetical protein [Agrobacterium sp.]
MKPLCSGINVSTNAGSNARTSPDLPDQQKQLTGRSLIGGIYYGDQKFSATGIDRRKHDVDLSDVSH